MTLRAGAAAVDISPRGPATLFGYPHVPRPAEGVHDPLLASTLWLGDSDSGGQAVLMSLDLLLLDPPVARRLRRAVAVAVGLPEACVFIGCTHTHSGPVSGGIVSWSADPTVPPPDEAYLEEMIGLAVESARRAADSAVDAQLAWTIADGCGIGGNRHRLDGPTDTEVGVLVVRSAADKRLLAIDVVYGMHPTVLHEDSRLVSADFPHYVRRQLQETFGEQLLVAYHTGPCGDQSPRRFVTAQTFAEAERLGRRLGQSVCESVARIDDAAFVDRCPLGGRIAAVELPRRVLPPVDEARRLVEACRLRFCDLEAARAPRAEVRTAECAIFGAEGTLQLSLLQADGRLNRVLAEHAPIEVHALRVGPAQLVGVPAELFVQYGLELKRRAAGHVFPVSLVGGHVQGYIVTADAAEQYEGLNAVFDGPAAGRVLVDMSFELAATNERRQRGIE